MQKVGDLDLLGDTAMGTFRSLVPPTSDRFLTTYKEVHTQICEPTLASSFAGLSGRDF
jgi:hypothetical protein